MTPSERYHRDFARPLKDGTGLPMREFVEYRGIQLSPWNAQRIAEYRSYRSLTAEDIARMVK